MKAYRAILATAILFSCLFAKGQTQVKYNDAGAGNPIIAGYFADPTIKKFGDTYYLYSTTDGNGGGKGPSQVWVSKDFVNWTLMPMNWPTTLYYWAPDVMEYNGKYYLFYCQPCMIYCGVSNSPRGPWHNILGGDEDVLIPDGFVKGAITLDGQSFVDDDGSAYLYWGTWGIYPDHGCGAGKFNIDKQKFDLTDLIPNTQAKDFFEGPFMVKKDGLYYFTYSSGSCHDHTYRVQYAVSDQGPLGPFTFPDNNPILATNDDRTVHGPGHHSLLQEGDDYYIVYHRHDIPNSTRGMHRQIAADRFVFGSTPGIIEKVVPTHSGIGYLQPSSNPFTNLAFGKSVTASSYYNDNFKPQYAVDDNNATLWRPKTCGKEWLQIDLGKEELIQRVWSQFEYPTAFVQYIIEVSNDAKNWTTYSDRTNNLLCGSPMVDYGNATARYLRLTFTGAQNNGTSGALWNIKVFGGYEVDPPQQLLYMPAAAFATPGKAQNRLGMLAGTLNTIEGSCQTGTTEGKSSVTLAAGSRLQSSWNAPLNLYGKNSYTLSYTIYGDGSTLAGCQIGWGNPQTEIAAKAVKQLSKGWHTVAIVSDGTTVKQYIDSQLISTQKSKKSKAAPAPFTISCTVPLPLSSLRLYNWAQSIEEVEFDSQSEMNRLPSPAPARNGLLARIDASAYLPGTTHSTILNAAGSGEFACQSSSLNVVLKNRRTAFAFDGTQSLTSSFSLPATMQGNAPYSVTAWFINPQLNDMEVIADLNRSYGELEKAAIGYGKSPSNGIANHNGDPENIGLRGLKGDEQWHHLAVTYDGYMEKIYIDGKLMLQKDIVLRLPQGDHVTIGSYSNGDNPFSGYISELSVYDTPLTDAQVAEQFGKAPLCNVALEMSAADIDFGSTTWKNEGMLGGSASFSDKAIGVTSGKISLLNGCTATALSSATKPIESIVIQFAAKRKTALVIKSGTTGIEYRKGTIHIANGSQKESIALSKEEAGEWITMVWMPKQKICYINGKQHTTHSVYLPGEELTFGENIARFGLYYSPFTPVQVEDMYNRSLLRSVDKINGTVLPITDNTIAYSITLPTEGAQDLSFNYTNPTTGWSSGWTKLTYARQNGLQMNKKYATQIKVRDSQGNIAIACDATVTITPQLFNTYSDEFASTANYVKAIPEGSIWQGATGFNPQEMQIESKEGQLVLGSKDREFSARGDKNGPLLYRTVEGDFVVQVELIDFSGYKERRAVALTEGGLMVMVENDGERNRQQLMQIGSFPYWNVGNMVTDLTPWGRPQYFNKKGYELDRFMQIERQGDLFFFRSSSDGITWEELPSSPIAHPELKGKKMKVGLYQNANSEGWGTVIFDNFKLWERNK